MQALHNDAIADMQSLLDDPLTPLPTARQDFPHLNLIVLAHDEYDRALRALLYRTLRHQDGACLERALEPHSHELSRQQHSLRVGEHNSRLPRPGIGF